MKIFAVFFSLATRPFLKIFFHFGIEFWQKVYRGLILTFYNFFFENDFGFFWILIFFFYLRSHYKRGSEPKLVPGDLNASFTASTVTTTTTSTMNGALIEGNPADGGDDQAMNFSER